MDYMYPSIFFAYFLFFVLTALTGYFFLRSVKHGDFGKSSEDPKLQMMREDDDE